MKIMNVIFYEARPITLRDCMEYQQKLMENRVFADYPISIKVLLTLL